jgi:UDP-N-acetylmuramoyl-L-alanyl-D-glutamate--2,6-diaminopimelate ligase
VLNAADAAWTHFAQCTPGQRAHLIGFGPAEQRSAFFAAAGNGFRSLAYLHMAACESQVYGIRGRWVLSTPAGVLAEAPYACRLLGAFQHDNLTAAAAAVYALLAPEQAADGLLRRIAALAVDMPGIPGRLELANTEGEPGPTVLIDYAHKPDALEKALRTLQTLKRGTARLICVFGCGGDRDRSKRPLMGEVAARLADAVVVTSDNPRTEAPEAIIDEIVAGIPATVPFVREADRRRAVAAVIAEAGQDDIVVIAGKGHEDYQIIGTTKYHLSDLEEARHALALRRRG